MKYIPLIAMSIPAKEIFIDLNTVRAPVFTGEKNVII